MLAGLEFVNWTLTGPPPTTLERALKGIGQPIGWCYLTATPRVGFHGTEPDAKGEVDSGASQAAGRRTPFNLLLNHDSIQELLLLGSWLSPPTPSAWKVLNTLEERAPASPKAANKLILNFQGR